MTLYTLLVFVHVIGAVGIFGAMGMEAIALRGLHRAGGPVDARAWLGMLALPGRLGPIAMVSTLGSGAWMMATIWGPRPWLAAGGIGLVGMAVAGGVAVLRRRRLRADAPAALGSVATLAAASLRLRIAVGVGIVALMTLKPGAAASWLILAAAAAAGALAASSGRRSSVVGRRSSADGSEGRAIALHDDPHPYLERNEP